MPAATGTPEMMSASSTLNRIGEAPQRHQRGGENEPLYLLPLLPPGAHQADHQAHRYGDHEPYVESEDDGTEDLFTGRKASTARGLGMLVSYTASPGENAASAVATGNAPSVIQVIRPHRGVGGLPLGKYRGSRTNPKIGPIIWDVFANHALRPARGAGIHDQPIDCVGPGHRLKPADTGVGQEEPPYRVAWLAGGEQTVNQRF